MTDNVTRLPTPHVTASLIEAVALRHKLHPDPFREAVLQIIDDLPPGPGGSADGYVEPLALAIRAYHDRFEIILRQWFEKTFREVVQQVRDEGS